MIDSRRIETIRMVERLECSSRDQHWETSSQRDFPGEEGVSFGELIQQNIIFELFALFGGKGDYLPGKDIHLKLVELFI